MPQEGTGHAPDYSEVFWSVSGPHLAFVLSEGHVQYPMNRSLDAPIATCCPEQSARRRRWVERLLASASLATGTRAYPESFPLIFRWPQVLAWWRDATAGRVMALLESVPL